jgi:hypothetical protein
VQRTFGFVLNVKFSNVLGYDIQYDLTLSNGSAVVYQSGIRNAYISSNGLLLVKFNLPMPENQTQYAISLSAHVLNSGITPNYTLELSAIYEIMATSTDNFMIITQDTCGQYASCGLNKEFICDSLGSGCIPNNGFGLGSQRESHNVMIDGTATDMIITADGTKFTAIYGDNQITRFMDNAWFYIKREYNCSKPSAGTDSKFDPNDLRSAFDIVGSVNSTDDRFSYTDGTGNRQGFIVDANISCLSPVCTVETSSVASDAFADGELRDDGTPKTRWTNEVRSCDITFGEDPICPIYEGEKLFLPCECDMSKQNVNAATAIATFKMAQKIPEAMLCSSQMTR